MGKISRFLAKTFGRRGQTTHRDIEAKNDAVATAIIDLKEQYSIFEREPHQIKRIMQGLDFLMLCQTYQPLLEDRHSQLFQMNQLRSTVNTATDQSLHSLATHQRTPAEKKALLKSLFQRQTPIFARPNQKSLQEDYLFEMTHPQCPVGTEPVHGYFMEWKNSSGIQMAFPTWYFSRVYRCYETCDYQEAKRMLMGWSGNGVAYYNPQQRKEYELTILDGKLVNATTKKPFDSTECHTFFGGAKDGYAMFVLSIDGKLYAADQAPGARHHSSFLAGGVVKSAGEFSVAKGTIRIVTGQSGHYRPSKVYLFNFLLWLRAHGISLHEISVYNRLFKNGPPIIENNLNTNVTGFELYQYLANAFYDGDIWFGDERPHTLAYPTDSSESTSTSGTSSPVRAIYYRGNGSTSAHPAPYYSGNNGSAADNQYMLSPFLPLSQLQAQQAAATYSITPATAPVASAPYNRTPAQSPAVTSYARTPATRAPVASAPYNRTPAGRIVSSYAHTPANDTLAGGITVMGEYICRP